MKNIFYFGLVFVFFVSCKSTVKKEDLNKINGYWEIEKVILSDGTTKDYKISETIDFFEISEMKGFRQKVMPQLDGTYLTNGVKESIFITNEGASFKINYQTNLAKWSEEIIELQDSILILKNKQQLEYHYKRAIPFTLK